MKQRLSALDIRALVAALKRKGLIGMKVANIYDISGRQYLVKFQRGSKKEMVLIESGIRMHTTSYQRDKNQIPSAYSMKLRKYLRSKFLSDIKQLGTDRVIVMTFGHGESAFHLILEFYAQGNIILTDHEYTVLALLRSHRFDENIKLAVKEKYPFQLAANQNVENVIDQEEKIINVWLSLKSQLATAEQPGKKKAKKNKGVTLRDLLMKMVPFINPQYSEHALRKVGVQEPTKKVEDQDLKYLADAASVLKKLVNSIDQFAEERAKEEEQDEKKEEKEEVKTQKEEDQKGGKQFSANGYILFKRIEKRGEKPEEEKIELKNEEAKQFEGLKFQDFSPVMLAQYQLASDSGMELLEFGSFDECIDIYFSQMDKQKVEAKTQHKENEIWKKVDRIKKDQELRIHGLKEEQSLSLYKAKLLQANIHTLNAIITILNLMLHSGLDWTEIQRMIKEEKRVGNQLALPIHKLRFDKNLIDILLYSEEQDQYFDDLSDIAEEYRQFANQTFKIEIDLSLSAQNNIQKYFQIKKKAISKEEKTKNAAQSALKHAERTAMKEMKHHQQAVKMEQIRKVYWFEKFDWFISSENYLVLAGRNAQQNELLFKRYMKKNDLYVHAEITGAATTIIKNHKEDEPIPPVTLNEAGIFCVCRSSAWNAKVPVGAFWVFPNQVSKTPPSGEYLPTGSFMIRGKKNFLLANRMEMGFTILFKFDELSMQNHVNERTVKVLGDMTSIQESSDVANLEDFGEQEDQEIEAISGDQDEAEEKEDIQEQKEETKEEEQGEEINEENCKAMAQSEQQEEEEKETQEKEEKEGLEEQAISEQKGETKQEQSKKKQGKQKKQKEPQKNESISQMKQKEKQEQLPRGKKYKMKKMKEKYGDQDEEEKAMKMELLGIKNMQDKGQKMKKEQEKAKEEQKKKESKEHKEEKKKDWKKGPKIMSPQEEQAAEEAALKEMLDSAGQLSFLSGIPKNDDTLLYAVPMCAPYSSITNYKYKVKVQPGTMRRGKAQKTIRQLFLQQAKNENEVEGTLIRAIPDIDMTMTLLNSIRVLAPGLTKMKNKSKK